MNYFRENLTFLDEKMKDALYSSSKLYFKYDITSSSYYRVRFELTLAKDVVPKKKTKQIEFTHNNRREIEWKRWRRSYKIIYSWTHCFLLSPYILSRKTHTQNLLQCKKEKRRKELNKFVFHSNNFSLPANEYVTLDDTDTTLAFTKTEILMKMYENENCILRSERVRGKSQKLPRVWKWISLGFCGEFAQ